MISGIYKITNKNNGKAYIGMSGNIFNRWRSHCSEKNTKGFMARIINEDGLQNFTFEILELVDDISIMGSRERHFIREHETFESGYNKGPGGGIGSSVKKDLFEEWIEENYEMLYKLYKGETHD